MNFLTLALVAAASLLLPASSSDQRLDEPQSQSQAQQNADARQTVFEMVTAEYQYDTEPSLESPGNTRLIYETGPDDPDGAACWFYPETGELALSGTVGKDGKPVFDEVPDYSRCPTMD